MKEMIEKLPPDVLDSGNLKVVLTRAENFLKENSEFETPSSAKSQQQHALNTPNLNTSSSKLQEHRIEENNETVDEGNVIQESNNSSLSNNEASMPSQNDSKSQHSSRPGKEGEMQVMEQFEPGVHVTLIVKPGGVRIFKRVKFRYYNYFC